MTVTTTYCIFNLMLSFVLSMYIKRTNFLTTCLLYLCFFSIGASVYFLIGV